MEKFVKVRILSHFSPIHEPLSFFTLLYTSQGCGSVKKVQQSQVIVAHFSQSRTPFYFYLVLQFSEVCKCAVV